MRYSYLIFIIDDVTIFCTSEYFGGNVKQTNKIEVLLLLLPINFGKTETIITGFLYLYIQNEQAIILQKV